MNNSLKLLCAALCAAGLQTTHAAASFVNGLALPGAALDLSGGTTVNDGRNGYFSDIYYDPNRKEWWGLSDRGPGGGTLSYDTRVQRFTIDINQTTGAISNFNVVQTVKFTEGGLALNGQAPTVSGTLGRSFDPEGFVVNPKTGNFLVSDEYGPSVYEFDRNGNKLRAFTTPQNLVPKVAGDPNYTQAVPTTGREGNRGFEGLAISPDGKYAYAVLQNGLTDDGLNATGTRSLYTRIVKFDTDTGTAVAQYAYKLESAAQGRGISALVALGDDKFLILERNNRGVGVGATVASPDKNVFKIDLSTATDVTGIKLPATGNLPEGSAAVSKDSINKVIDLDANTLAALGNKSPEKWEGLAVGPQLANGLYMMLAGTDNDYSVTQNGSNTQFDVYFRYFLPDGTPVADPYASSIQCPIGATSECFFTSNASTAASLTSDYSLLPGVLHSYTISASELAYATPVPEADTYAMMLLGLGTLGALARRRRRQA